MVEANNLVTKVEIFVAARELINKDTFSKSDPFCCLDIQYGSGSYTEIGMTEVKKNNLNPTWKKTFQLDYYFEAKQPLKFSVFDYDEENSDDLGNAFITLGELVGKGTSFLKLNRGGTLVVRVEEVKLSRDAFMLRFRGIKLDKKDTFGKSDPYLIFYRNISQNQWTEIHRTEIIKNTLDPVWNPFELTEQKLCNSDRNKPIKVECYDWDKVGSHDLIGIFETTLVPLVTRGSRFELRNPKKNKPAGTIELTDSVVRKNLSFIDYLRSGVQISLSVAIDFTASNGEYSDKNSLHHIGEKAGNEYERAIWEIGGILEAYDTDKYFPVFGFGGVPHGKHEASHCFPLTGDLQNPYVLGTQGILDLYRSSLTKVALSGPTFFHHIIDQTITVASSTSPQSVYHVLLILTDGVIMDMDKTLNSIVQAASLPMSIIIVGVGNADFDMMEQLDCDNGALVDSQGRKAVRDIVQFVPFRKHGGNPVQLAAEVLKEVPSQLTNFMKSINYTPDIPETRPISEEAESSSHHHHHHH
ncbi:hypothetical protein SteCoe_4827 [Stentor coeruleus]|uniref:C2 domain-containing protein n=1 Tax=Stentor coeruleus TaxID=5963 RepID=A0A1R2CTT0_9CILI|nr:hypothetical protein SteCoe_4827 [Stentor coeruleus]